MMRKKIPINHNDQETTSDAHSEADAANTGSHNQADDGSNIDSESGAEAYIVALQAELEEARIKAEESEKRILYVQAEFQNYRRRKEDEFKELQRFANGELLLGVLPIVDSFERAVAAAEQTQNFESLLAGLNGTLKQLHTFLQKAGVQAIEALGKEFDPKFHEAIGHTESDEYPPHTVAEEVQRGYLMKDRVLRPALVKVTED
jgi:molecular chaperone GrpE